MSKRQNIIIAAIVLCALAGAWWFFNRSDQNIVFTLSNTCSFDRQNELVEVPFNAIGHLQADNYVLVDSLEQPVPYQLTESSLLFQANVPANSTATYRLRQGNPSAPIDKVFARFVPERKDDFAWENDIAAYRMYGPALADENPSNGVDLWLKKTDELIVDTFYYREHELGLPYHIDYGKGLDCYKVGHTVGCGGVALLLSDSLLVGNHYDHYEIVEAGPLRTIFELQYDSVLVGEDYLNETLRITTCAGSILNKAEVLFEGNDIQELALCSGIFLHGSDVDGVIASGMPLDPWIAYAERATSDAGLPAGRNYVGVVVPLATDTLTRDGSLLIAQAYNVGQQATYYFGGGWSQWLFSTDQEWFDAMSKAYEAIQSPLQLLVIENE